MRRLAEFGILESNPEEVFTDILGYHFAVLGEMTIGHVLSGLIDTHQARRKEYGTLGSFLGGLLPAMETPDSHLSQTYRSVPSLRIVLEVFFVRFKQLDLLSSQTLIGRQISLILLQI
jgi:hypothetical protein